MSFRVDEKWLEEYQRRGGRVISDGSAPATAGAPDAPKRRKYGNEPVETDGKRFDSRHEARVYEDLRLRCLAGEFIGIGRQVMFYLPGGVKYIADFVTFTPQGGFVVWDAKSEATRKDKVYRLKKRQMENCIGIEIQEA